MKKKSQNIKYLLRGLFAISLTMVCLNGQETEVSDVKVYDLEALVVNADLLGKDVELLNSSSTIIGTKDLNLSGANHFQNLISAVPNLNWVGGTSRPRFFQIRGIGESSQFGNEPPATSVGFIIDGIDFTGMGMAASLFDVGQVEVLRGPQAAAFGANAMAGMILMSSNDPTPYTEGAVELSRGSDDLWRGGIALGGPLGSEGSDLLTYRFSVAKQEQDGFRDNTFLNRDDVNERNELSSRLKLKWKPLSKLEINLTGIYLDFDNGYDMWALDNDSFNLSSDEPGRDEQITRAFGWDVTFRITEQLDLYYQGSTSSSDFLYSFDWDWSNPEELEQLYGPEIYYGIDETERERKVNSHDFRLRSVGSSVTTGVDSWVLGVYAKDFEEAQRYHYSTIYEKDPEGWREDFESTAVYLIKTTALYGQLDYKIKDDLIFEIAFRTERTELDYEEAGTQLGNKDDLWGGKLALNWNPFAHHRFYISADRGYKIGGVNLDSEVPTAYRVYDTETLYNYELGWKGRSDDGRFQSAISFFYMDRKDIQVDSSFQTGNGNSFALFKDNAATGKNHGVELEFDYYITSGLKTFFSLGYLNAKFKDYQYVNPADPSMIINLSGGRQAYSPRFNYRIGINYESENGVFGSVSLHGVDDIIFDLPSNSGLKGYSLVDLSIGYKRENWKLTLWINNFFDEGYDVRGFYFANEPPFYDNPKIWRSQGDPRQIGMTFRYEF